MQQHILDAITNVGLTFSREVEGHPICSSATGEEYIMKPQKGAELQMYTQIFPKIRQMNLNFQMLQLPEYYRDVTVQELNPDDSSQNHSFIFIRYYGNDSFNNMWNESESRPLIIGGRGILSDFATKVIMILKDLHMIDLSQLAQFHLSTFDFSDWKTLTMPFLINLTVNKIIRQEEADALTALVQADTYFEGSQKIITNGDFYPRNFLKLPNGKIVLIDWENVTEFHSLPPGTTAIIPNQRIALINFIENHIGFMFIHMWGNYAFQKKLLKEAAAEFHLEAKNLQMAILIKSLEQAAGWGGGYPGVRESEVFAAALNSDYIPDLLN